MTYNHPEEMRNSESTSQSTPSSNTQYAVYNNDRSRNDNTTERPIEGFYYAQDDPDGPLTLYQVVGDHHVPVETFPSSEEALDYRVTWDGTAFTAEGQDIGNDEVSYQIEGGEEAGDALNRSEAESLADVDLWDGFEDNPLLSPEPGDDDGSVILPVPRGATQSLTELIAYTQGFMQDKFDAIGLGDPDSAPDLSIVIEDIENLGWTEIIENEESETSAGHGEFSQRMARLQEAFDMDNHAVKIDIDNLTSTGREVYDELTAIKKTLIDDLGVDLIDYFENHDGLVIEVDDDGNIVTHSQDEANVETKTRFVMTGDGNKREWELHPDAEQHYYTNKIVAALDKFEAEFQRGQDEFRSIANDIDNTGNDTGDEGGNGNNDEEGGNDGTNGTDAGNTDGLSDPFDGSGLGNPEDLFGDLIGDTDGEGGTDGEPGADEEGAGGSGLTAEMLEGIIRDLEAQESGGTDADGSGDEGNDSNGTGDAGGGSGDSSAPAPTPIPAQTPSSMGGMESMIPAALMSSLAGNNLTGNNRNPSQDPRARDPRDTDLDASPYAPHPEAVPIPGSEMPAPVTAPESLGTPPQTVAPRGGMVDIKLPDGSSQRASSVVAEAVNRELHNPNGSDGRAAYAGTPAQASSGSPWTQVDSATVRTGDVVQWENRSALVVATDEGLKVIVNGQVLPLDPHNPPDDGNGAYGDFIGFFHPTGIDQATTTNSNTPGEAEPPAVTAANPNPPEPPAVEAPTLR